MGGIIFISYSRKDSTFTRQLVSDLNDLGLETWADWENIKAGGTWREQIVKGIKQCQTFILVLSPNSANSKNVTKEITLAEKYGKKIIHLIYEKVEIPESIDYQLAGIQHIDFQKNDYSQNVAELASTIKNEKYPIPTIEPTFFQKIIAHPNYRKAIKYGSWVLGVISTITLIASLYWDVIKPFLPMPEPSPTPIIQMESGYNVAVAYFTTIDKNGRIVETEETKQISEWLFWIIEEEVRNLPTALKFTVRGPLDIGVIPGADRAARERNAAIRAGEHNATLLIYGVVTIDENGNWVSPEFYVSGEEFGYAGEISGPDNLGSPVSFITPLVPGELLEVNLRLNARANALQHLIVGLAQFYIGEYKFAADEFSKAAKIDYWGEENDNQGKEVLYFLIGTAYLRMYDESNNFEYLSQADENFHQAYALNNNYIRNYLGLGAVALQYSIYPDPDQANLALCHIIDEDKLNESVVWHKLAFDSLNQSDFTYVNVKAAFGLGEIHIIGFECGMAAWSPEAAQDFFEIVVNKYEEEENTPYLAWFAGHSYYFLGRISSYYQDWEAMSTQTLEAIDVLNTLPNNPPKRQIAIYWESVSFAETKLGDYQAALEACENAVETGTGKVTPEELTRFQSCIDTLEAEGQ